MAVIKAPKAINPQTTKPTINVSIISLNAAFLAFPECFMPAQGKASAPPVKGKRNLELSATPAHKTPNGL
jgi:hypothetical protein